MGVMAGSDVTSSAPIISEANLKALGADSIEEILKRDGFIGVLSMDGSKIAFGQRGVAGHNGHLPVGHKYHFTGVAYLFAYAQCGLHLYHKYEYAKGRHSALTPEDIRALCGLLRSIGMPADTPIQWNNDKGVVASPAGERLCDCEAGMKP